MCVYQPNISIVIPTHNRCTLLRQLLDSLCVQTYPLQQVEVIVVADGCTDGTLQMVNQYNAPFSLRLFEQSGQGAAVARNLGARHATGQILLFLDDDIEPTRNLVQAHVKVHQQSESRVVLGYLPPVIADGSSFFQIELRSWWEAAFEEMRKPGHRYKYTNLLSGNFSLKTLLFHQVGGFDESLQCREDFELGMRLIQSGAKFVFEPDALGYHHETTNLYRSLQRKYNEGRADVMIGQLYPELHSTFLLARLIRFRSLLQLLMQILVFNLPQFGDRLSSLGQLLLKVLELIRLRGLWRFLLDGLLGYWYWRGVADELPSRQSLSLFLPENFTHQESAGIGIDLRGGIDAAERLLDSVQPICCQIYYGSHFIGAIPPEAGAERLCGVHLRPWLFENAWQPLFIAITLEEPLQTLSPQQLILALDRQKV